VNWYSQPIYNIYFDDGYVDNNSINNNTNHNNDVTGSILVDK